MKAETSSVKLPVGLWVLAGLVAIGVGGVAFTLFSLNPLAKKLLLEQAAPLFGDNLTLGTVRLAPLKGELVVKEITLKQSPGFGTGNLLHASRVRVKADLKRLLKKELVIEEVTLLSPEINFIQQPNGGTNTRFYLSKIFSSRETGASGPDFNIRLDKFMITNGRLNLVSYRLCERQPALNINKLQIRLEHLRIPNPQGGKCVFSSSGMIAATEPIPFRITGSGIFQGAAVQFDAQTTLDNLALEEFTHLFPPSNLTIKSGILRMTAKTHCEGSRIVSKQRVIVEKLRVAPGKKGIWRKALLGLPANLFIKALDDKDGMLDFDFEISGPLDDLKVNLKEAIHQAVNRSLAKKFHPTSASGAKKVENGKKTGNNGNNGNKLKSSLRKLLRRE